MPAHLESLRSAVIQRLELARLSELLGKKPWDITTNAAYDQRQAALAPVSVSVIVTLYNYAAYIHQCLDSICASDTNGLPNGFEIVVINDCSTDHSAQLVQDYLDKHADIPICLVNKQFNTGLADARNLGLKLALAPYVFMLDADNWIHSNCLSRLYEAIPGAAAAYGRIRQFNADTDATLEIISNSDWDLPTLIRQPYIDAMALFDRQILRSIGGYSTELIHYGWFGWEDYDLWLKLAEANHQCRFVAEILSEYRVHSGSMISTTNLVVVATAQYFRQKFQALVAQYPGSDLLFGQPPEQTLALEAQQQQQIQRLQKQLRQAQDQSQQQMRLLQMQMQQMRTQLRQTQEQASQRHRNIQQQLQRTEQELQLRDLELQFATTGRDQYLGRLQAIEGSKFWQIRTQWLLLKNMLLRGKENPFWQPEIPYPQPIRPEPEARHLRLDSEFSGLGTYERWQQQHEPRAADYPRLKETLQLLPYKPLISVILPVYNTPEPFLRAAIDSVINQIYPHWELCIADDASTELHVQEILEDYLEQDPRIKAVFRPENGHISQNSNSALKLAGGEFIALLDHDDALRPEALYEVAFLLNQHPEADMIYTDEDKIDEFDQRHDPFFKPDWCPDSFLTRMYTCHLGIYRRSLVNQIGGFRMGYEGSQDYDLVLRLTEATDQIFHIPKVLYHWRVHHLSTASSSNSKPYAYIAAQKALSEALQRRGEPGTVEDVPDYLGVYHLRYEILKPGKVSIIIPTRDLAEMLEQCLSSIFTQTTYPDYEVILIDNGSVEAETHRLIQRWQEQEPQRFHCHRLDIPFNYSKLNNQGAAQATGDYLLFLNNDTEVITPDWLEAMVEQAQRPSVGAVGALLLYPDDRVQHAGVIVGIGPFAGHAFIQSPSTAPGYLGQLLTSSNYSAVTGACLMCRRAVFEAAGGFDEALVVALNDIDLCLKMRQQGYYNLFTPHAKLYHYESKSRGYEDSPKKQERYNQECEYARQKWQEIYEHDPCYSPHLTRAYCDYRIRED